LQKNLVYAGVHISSSAVQRRLREKAKKPLKSSFLFKNEEDKIRMGKKHK